MLGENEIYFHSNGLPGSFTVLDAETGKKNFSHQIPNTETVRTNFMEHKKQDKLQIEY